MVNEGSGVTVKAVVNNTLNDADIEWAKHFNIPPITEDLASVLGDPDIHAVAIAASTTSHVKLIKEAASAGKHVFCEKPVALNPEQIKEAINATRKSLND